MITGKPLKDRDPDDIHEALKKRDVEEADIVWWLKLHKYACDQHPPLGMSALEGRTRISTSILSEGFNGLYTGDYHAITLRIQQFFARLEDIALYGGRRNFRETTMAKALWDTFKMTRHTRRIQFVQSPEQLGKTTAAKEYTARNNSGRTIYQELSGGSKSGCGDFIWNLCETLEIPYTLRMREKRIRIRHCMKPCDLVIIDQAHFCWTWPTDSTRDFFDYIITDIHANGERGVVLIATNDDMLKGLEAFRKSARYNIGQLIGRMNVSPVVIDPAEDILESDIKLLVSRYYEPSKTTLRKLFDLCRREGLGHFGLLDYIMNQAWIKAMSQKINITDEIVCAKADEAFSLIQVNKKLYE